MRRLLIALALLAAMTPAGASGGCLQDGGTLLQSLDCLGLPTIDKYYQPRTFQWGQQEVLVLNTGNDLAFWKVVNPAAPTPIGRSRFNMGHQGDSDHDLTGYSICDGCRFGVASFKRGTVVFDMGTGALPSIGSHFSKYLTTNPRSSFTYRNGASQYIISRDLQGSNTTLTVFRVTSHDPGGVVRVRDFQPPPGTMASPILGAFDFGETILLNINGTFYAYRKAGDDLTFVRNTGMKAAMGFYDSAARYGHRVVTAQDLRTDNGLKMWNVANPEYPALMHTLPGRFRMVGYSGRSVITSTSAGIQTFGVVGDAFVPLDQAFWGPGNPWNQWPKDCSPFMGAVFDNGGGWGYLSRYSVFQKINFTACSGSSPTPTPTPQPWPTPQPTCVPGCTMTGG